MVISLLSCPGRIPYFGHDPSPVRGIQVQVTYVPASRIHTARAPATRVRAAHARATWVRVISACATRIRAHLVPAFLLFALPCTPTVTLGQTGLWEAIGPGDGTFQIIIRNPSNPAELLASTGTAYDSWSAGMSPLFRSTDRGESWHYLSSLVRWPRELIWDRQDPLALYCYNDDVISRSLDGGLTWSDKPLGNTVQIADMEIDPVDHTVLHAAGRSIAPPNGTSQPAYCRATAAAENFTIKTLSTLQGTAEAVAVDLAHPEMIYIAGEVAAQGPLLLLWRSSDGGATFSSGTALPEWFNVLAVDTSHGGRLFGLGNSNLYMSTNRGDSWVGSTCDTLDPAAIFFVDGIVYVSSHLGHVFKSSDGLNFRPLSQPEPLDYGWVSKQSICVEPTSPHTLYLASTFGIRKSTDGGSTWKSCSCGMTLGTITSLRVVPGVPGRLIAARATLAVFKTLDASATPVMWDRLPDFYACTNVSDLAVSPLDPNFFLAMEGGS